MQDLHDHIKSAVSTFATVLDQKFSSSSAALTAPATRPLPSILHYFRLHSCMLKGVDAIPDLDGYKRLWTSNEYNAIVSCAVRASLTTAPFNIALVGYSRGGKSHTTFSRHRHLAGILVCQAHVYVQATEVLDCSRSLGSYMASTVSVADISASGTRSCVRAPTAANGSSSRTHLVLRFEDPQTDTPYGILLDVTGPERL